MEEAQLAGWAREGQGRGKCISKHKVGQGQGEKEKKCWTFVTSLGRPTNLGLHCNIYIHSTVLYVHRSGCPNSVFVSSHLQGDLE